MNSAFEGTGKCIQDFDGEISCMNGIDQLEATGLVGMKKMKLKVATW